MGRAPISITNRESRVSKFVLSIEIIQNLRSLKLRKNATGTMAATKVALITASSAGLGAQIARVFAPDFRVVGSN